MCYTGLCISVSNMFALTWIVNCKHCISLAFGIHSLKLRCVWSNISIQMRALTQNVYLKSQGTPADTNCFVILKLKRRFLPYFEYRLPSVHDNELTFKMRLNFLYLNNRV